MEATPTSTDPRNAMNSTLLSLRPAIATVAATPAESATEGQFLHGTLRPLLKLQNELLLAAVADFVLDHHIALAKASPADQQRQLAELLTRNTKLRYTVVGLITGLFTNEEYAYYRANRSELNRRLLELARRRVLDQASRVVELVS